MARVRVGRMDTPTILKFCHFTPKLNAFKVTIKSETLSFWQLEFKLQRR
jgi:hypothetical protein